MSGEDNMQVMWVLNNILTRAKCDRVDCIVIHAIGKAGAYRFTRGETYLDGAGLECLRAHAIIDRLKVMAALHLEEHTKPQEGQFEVMIQDRLVNIRVGIAPILDGEVAALRLTYP